MCGRPAWENVGHGGEKKSSRAEAREGGGSQEVGCSGPHRLPKSSGKSWRTLWWLIRCVPLTGLGDAQRAGKTRRLGVSPRVTGEGISLSIRRRREQDAPTMAGTDHYPEDLDRTESWAEGKCSVSGLDLRGPSSVSNSDRDSHPGPLVLGALGVGWITPLVSPGTSCPPSPHEPISVLISLLVYLSRSISCWRTLTTHIGIFLPIRTVKETDVKEKEWER